MLLNLLHKMTQHNAGNLQLLNIFQLKCIMLFKSKLTISLVIMSGLLISGHLR